MMKKLISLLLSLAMLANIVPSAFATGNFPLDSTGSSVETRTAFHLYSNIASATRGAWVSTKFATTPSNGSYIQVAIQNNTKEAIRVYVHRIDADTDVLMKSFSVEANNRNSKVFINRYNESCTYQIYIEAYVSGGVIDGPVAVTQCRANPNL